MADLAEPRAAGERQVSTGSQAGRSGAISATCSADDAAGDGGQINKLWERRAAAAAPNRSGFPMPAPLAIPCASIAAAYRKKSLQRNLQQISR